VLLNAAKTRKNKDGKTLYEWAESVYGERLDVAGVEEEAIAELISHETAIGGRPRHLINRIKQFIEQMRSALTGQGFTTFESVLTNYETGKIGKRKRGEVRTFREIDRQPLVQDEVVVTSDKGFKSRWVELNRALKEATGQNLNSVWKPEGLG